MRINTNVASLQAQEANINTNKSLQSSLEKLSTGLSINKAADDASGLAIADKLRTQATSLNQGIANANSASALIQIADKALGEQTTIMDTVKSKLIQAGTATTTEEGREAIRKDITKLLSQVDEIAKQTNYNGLTLLQKSATETSKSDTFTFQLGEKAEFDVNLEVSKASNTVNLGGGSDAFGASSINGSVTAANVQTANQVGQSLDGSGTQHNNIGTNGVQNISSTAAMTLTAVDIAVDGTEAAATNYGIDVNISGEVGSVVATGGAAMYHFSNQSQELKDFAKSIATQDDADPAAGDWAWDADKEILTVADGNSVAFGDLQVSSLRVSEVETIGGGTYSNLTSLEVNKNGKTDAAGTALKATVTVENNYAEILKADNVDDLGSAGQLNVSADQATDDYTVYGGKTLAELKDIKELTYEAANSFMAVVDEAMTQLNGNRADFGSSQNQIQSSLRSMQTTVTNLQAAESVIRDVDYASESANFNKQNIISQAGTYALSQANQVQQNVLRLLQ